MVENGEVKLVKFLYGKNWNLKNKNDSLTPLCNSFLFYFEGLKCKTYFLND